MDVPNTQFPKYHSYQNEHDCWVGEIVASQEEINKIEAGVEKRRKALQSRLHRLDTKKSLAEQFRLSLRNGSVSYFPPELYGNLFDHYIVNNNHTYKLDAIPGKQLEDIFCEMVNLPKSNKYLHLSLFRKWIKRIMAAKTPYASESQPKEDTPDSSLPPSIEESTQENTSLKSPEMKMSPGMALSDQLPGSGRGRIGRGRILGYPDHYSRVNPHYFGSPHHHNPYYHHNSHHYTSYHRNPHHGLSCLPQITERYGYTIIENIDKGNIIDLSF